MCLFEFGRIRIVRAEFELFGSSIGALVLDVDSGMVVANGRVHARILDMVAEVLKEDRDVGDGKSQLE
jgi:hypothetical protein